MVAKGPESEADQPLASRAETNNGCYTTSSPCICVVSCLFKLSVPASVQCTGL